MAVKTFRVWLLLADLSSAVNVLTTLTVSDSAGADTLAWLQPEFFTKVKY